MNIDFNTHILTQLLKQNSDKADEVVVKFPKINDWKLEKTKPTYNQLVGLADYFNIPFGYFFLNDIPIKKYPIPHYRSFSNAVFKPSTELLETIQIIDKRQDWAKDTLREFQTPLKFANSISIKTKIQDAAQLIRNILKLPTDWAKDTVSWNDAFKLLLNRTEEAGIFVVINGVVNHGGNNLDINEFRGFVLYDNYAPFIFINGKDVISGKIFTIIHEIVHILIGQSASFDFTNLMPANNTIEQYCNSVAAEFLVPEALLEKEYKIVGNNYDILQRIFKVSRIVIARRLFDLNKISKKDFFSAYNSFKISTSENPNKNNGGGGAFYNTAPYRIGRSFFDLVYSSVKQNKIFYRDAFKLTGLSPKSFDGYIREHLT